MTKEEIINQLIKDNGYKSYLEIGYGDGYCFNQIECAFKEAVDPKFEGKDNRVFGMPSDDYFKENETTFDVIFIDGLHHANQVRKDIINASKILSEKGVILCHDIAPEDEWQSIVPRKQRVWTGDVYKAWEGFKEKYPDIEVQEYPVQYGLGAIYPNGKKFRAHFEIKEMTWEEYQQRKNA